MKKDTINYNDLQEIEVEAKTVPEAIRIALARLGENRGGVHIQILREENKGLFSMQGAKLAKVKVINRLRKN